MATLLSALEGLTQMPPASKAQRLHSICTKLVERQGQAALAGAPAAGWGSRGGWGVNAQWREVGGVQEPW